MAKTKGDGGRFPAQVVFTTTVEQREAVQGVADQHAYGLGVSRAEVIRRCITAGLGRVMRDLDREAKRA